MMRTLPKRGLIFLTLALIVGGVVGLGAIRRPYGEVYSQQSVSPPRPPATIEGAPFRVATFNIHSGRDVEGIRNLTLTAQTITGFDLIGLNEVRGGSLLRETNQAEQLGRRLGMAAVFGPSERRWYVTAFGNGLLSRFQILRWRSRPMRIAGESSYRAVIHAEMALRNRKINVIVAHVERGRARDPQLRELADLFAGTPAPAVLVGDLNASLSHEELRRIEALPGVVHAHKNQQRTASRQIDHIYVKGVEVQAAGVIETQASDHPVVWADLQFPVS